MPVMTQAEKSSYDKAVQDLKNKVDKAQGKGLSEEDFTTALKQKLSTIEGSHFKGVHTDLATLETAHPAVNAEPGSYAYIKDTGDEKLAMLDGASWVEMQVGGQPLTAAQIKSLYESNADTNVLTDAEKARIGNIKVTAMVDLDVLKNNLAAEILRTTGVDYTPGVPGSTDENLKTDHIAVATPIRMEGTQTIPMDKTIAKASKELMTIGSVFTMMEQLKAITMMDKGAVPGNDITNIDETGIYAGLDVANSPVTGGIMVMANKDAHGNIGFFLMGEDRVFHTGGRASTETTITWAAIQTKPVAEGTVSINPSYGGGFTVIEFPTFTGGATIDLGDGAEHKVMFDLKASADWAAGIDPRGWYLDNHSVLGQVQGTNGVISPVTLKQWVDHGNIVTIKLDATNKLLHILKVEGDTAVTHSTPILADGSVQMVDTYVPADDFDVVTKKFLEDNAAGDAPGGLFQFQYIWEDGAQTTVSAKHIAVDNADVTAATKILVNKIDNASHDMSLFLQTVADGDYFNIHDGHDVSKNYSFNVTGDAVLNGDVFEIPVTYYASSPNHTISNRAKVDVAWTQASLTVNNMKFKGAVTSLDGITEMGIYEGNDVSDAPKQGKFIVTVIKDNEGNMGYTLVDDEMGTHLGGKPAGQPHITWHFKIPDHISGTADPVDTQGADGDIYMKLG